MSRRTLAAVVTALTVSSLLTVSSPAAGPTTAAPPASPAVREAVRDAGIPKAERDRILARVDAALSVGRREAPVAGVNPPWEVLHWIIAFGPSAEVADPARPGRGINAVTYLCEKMEWKGVPVFAPAPGGVAVNLVEGHPHQFLAKLGRAGVPLTQPLTVPGKSFTMADLLSAAKLSAVTTGEVSWTLLAMTVHLPIDAKWTNSRGEAMDIPTLLEAELATDPAKCPCGGCHGLHAVSLAVQKAAAAGIPLDRGVWKRAADRQAEYIRLAQEGQLPDGAFSEIYWGRKVEPRDYRWLIYSTGHVLEWLMYALPDERVAEPWVARAADRLAQCIVDNASAPVGKDSYYHALHGLAMYRERLGKVAAAAAKP